MVAINGAMSSVTKTLTAFTRERAIVGRERTRGAYDAGPYLAAKIAAELPLSAAFPALFSAVVYPVSRARRPGASPSFPFPPPPSHVTVVPKPDPPNNPIPHSLLYFPANFPLSCFAG